MTNRPNILWLCSDQQRFDTIHALGNACIDTPNLDALCARGTAFTSAYCQCPICTPSRASFLSGRYPSAVNANINGGDNPPEHCKLLPRYLADAGYTCGLIGKLHISACWGDYENRLDDGYSYFCHSLGSGHHLEGSSQYAAWLREKGVDWHTLFTNDGKHDYYWYRDDAPIELRQTAWCAEKAIDFMRTHTDAPWLLSVNCFDPHPPYDAPKALVEKYLARHLPDPYTCPEDEERAKKFASIHHQLGYRPYTDDHVRYARASYYAMCEIIDTHYGQIISALEALGIADQTVVIYTSDHGEMLGDHGYTHKGCRFYEGLVHVPLMISVPGQPGGQRYTHPVELTDIAPTIAELCGIEMHDIHGHSLLPAIKGNLETPIRPFVRTEYYNTLLQKNGAETYGDMYFDGRYKLCVYHGIEDGELYDLQNDPHENHNLWDDPALASKKLSLLLASYDATVRLTRPGQVRRGRY